MKPLYLLAIGVVVGWAASGVDWSREAVGQDGELQFDQSKPARVAQPEGATPKSIRAVDAAAVADASKAEAGKVEVYKALTRREIEELGGIGKKEGILGSHFRYLTAGLNALANDRWFLVVIEPSLGYAKRGVHAADTVEPAVYIFEKR
jgi:cation diffusion facilitator CzcD-associated flavoprotein CzcO